MAPDYVVGGGTQPCPSCGREYTSLASHWARSTDCSPPVLSESMRAFATGLMIGDASVDGRKHTQIEVQSTRLPHLAWCHRELGPLSNGVTETDTVYRLRTMSHPGLDRYRRWYGTGEKRVPDHVSLTLRSARAWYACDGSMGFSGRQQAPQISFSAVGDGRREDVERLLSEVGFEPVVLDRRVQFQGGQVRAWLDWLGEPVPGSVYKWCLHPQVYEAAIARVRDGDPVRTPGMDQAEWYRAVLPVVAEARGLDRETLTRAVFDESVAGVNADEVAAYLGGGSWESALRVADVPAVRPTAGSDGGQQGRERVYSREDVCERIRECASVYGEPLSSADYIEWATGEDGRPSLQLITSRFESWAAACDAAGVEDVGGHREALLVYDESDVVRALRTYAGVAGEPVAYEGYAEWTVGREEMPSTSVVVDRVFSSWVAACEAAGVEPAGTPYGTTRGDNAD